MAATDPGESTDASADASDKTPIYIRLWPFYIILAGLGLAWYFGLFDVLSFDTLKERREELKGFVEANLVLAFLAYIVIYALATLFMVPGALWITIAGGFLFGLFGGTPATIIGATLGASGLFLAAKTSLGKALSDLAGSWVRKLEKGFKDDEVSYMFAMRFVPAMPFPIANIAPALLGAKYRNYLLTTALGIIPGVLAYTWIGSGLGAALDAGEEPDLGTFALKLAPAFIALFVVSLIPVAYKRLSGKAKKLEEVS